MCDELVVFLPVLELVPAQCPPLLNGRCGRYFMIGSLV